MPAETTTVASSLGCKLRAALADAQLQTLLDVVGEAGYLDVLEEKLHLCDADLADAVRRKLASPSSKSGRTPSAGKILEIWPERWSAWSGCIAEVGHKEGPYVNHEEDWHPPYFDQSALEDDLETAATRLAQVKVKGRDLGILCKPPFRVDVTDALKHGDNMLEALPEDSQRNGDGTLKAWPPWVNEGQPSPAGRFTSTSWRLWEKTDELVPSGLLGPVTLQSAQQLAIP